MILSDMMAPDGRVFLKSEWAQIGDGWPCLSFTKSSVFRRLRADFRPEHDVLLYVGTSGEDTDDPNHRSRLISAVVVQPSQMLETRKIVPPEAYALAMARFGVDRWPHAVAVIKAANLVGPPFPSARELVPDAYRSLGAENRGQVAEVVGAERLAVLSLAVVPLELRFSPDVAAYMALAKALGRQTPKSINTEATRMAALILNRVANGGEMTTRMNPIRTAPDFSVLFALLVRKWQEGQGGACALCRGPLVAQTTNAMLQPSADRIVSENPAYDDENVQITHLACNLAKNKWGAEHFDEWAAVIRGLAGPVEDADAEAGPGAELRAATPA
ncbi:hypothetical protein [Caulobacter rhizosphaerae]|uniref:hypothetical protein n=1 Tax=Caulobacter rhizosphaerae TaxID=2010972 RepID=UPI0016697437|nr:hypothetical protein [Caulobacter rhizosphaerae]GGL35932.1 hypothetical protein GCM10010983_36240 [Caulobacter rhizosphaerae]